MNEEAQENKHLCTYGYSGKSTHKLTSELFLSSNHIFSH